MITLPFKFTFRQYVSHNDQRTFKCEMNVAETNQLNFETNSPILFPCQYLCSFEDIWRPMQNEESFFVMSDMYGRNAEHYGLRVIHALTLDKLNIEIIYTIGSWRGHVTAFKRTYSMSYRLFWLGSGIITESAERHKPFNICCKALMPPGVFCDGRAESFDVFMQICSI